jgi:predicted nuclease of predicted toxin-antitoxin system
MSSAASSRSRRDAGRLASVVFFIDRSLGGRVIAEALRASGAQVEVHDKHFASDAPDVEWLAAVGKQGWVVLSKDARIRRDAFEREALRSASVKAFFLTQQGLTGEEMAQIFVAALPGMVTRASRQPGPFVYTLSRGGVFAHVKLKP